MDPSTGRAFYIDHVNRRTAWERPTAPAVGSQQPSYARPPSAITPTSGGGAQPFGSGGNAQQFDSDAELARELAAQFEAEEAAEAADAAERSTATRTSNSSSASGRRADRETKSKTVSKLAGKEDWADDASATECFLTGTRFTVVQRKHHCRYCGQIFINDVCKRMLRIPSEGYSKEAVRVCGV